MLAAIAATDAAPRPQDVGINPQRVIRPSHSELTQQEYERIAAALADVVRSL
jgi:hypothetical protein